MAFGKSKNATITPAPSIQTQLAQAEEAKRLASADKAQSAEGLRSRADTLDTQSAVDAKHAAALAKAFAILDEAGVEL